MNDLERELEAARKRVAELEAQRLSATGQGPQPSTRAPTSVRSWSYLVVGALILIGLIVITRPSPDAIGKSGTSAANGQGTSAALVAEEPSGPPSWSYQTNRDPLTDKAVELACINSIDEVRLGFPYKDQQIRLCLRRSPQYGLDAYIAMPEGGQFKCSSYSNCKVSIRFDDGPVQAFSGAEASDGSSDVLFIVNAQRFLSGLTKAKKTRILAEYYENGNQTSEFATADFDPSKMSVKPKSGE